MKSLTLSLTKVVFWLWPTLVQRAIPLNFITHKDTPWLNGKHTIFGHVTEGMNVVNAIAQGDAITKITITRKGALAKKDV
jgi:hypothetical protein